jgi:hypothetical protein
MSKLPSQIQSRVYFSEVLEIDPTFLARYGAFDISLVNDLPLFVDPFLLFHSGKREYRRLHDEVIRYVAFLRDKSLARTLGEGELRAWFMFPEVKQNWLGYSLNGNDGRGLGMDFAIALNKNLGFIFKNFGDEKVTQSSHIEKLTLIDDGVGRDNLSDFATNLIKAFLLRYTEKFARRYLRPDQCLQRRVTKAEFNYNTEAWMERSYYLPYVNGDFVILTPEDLLTKDDGWINRKDYVDEFENVAAGISNSQLRAQVNNYFERTLEAIQKRDYVARERRKNAKKARRQGTSQTGSLPAPTSKQKREATVDTLERFPELIDWYIRWKERNGDRAEAQSLEKVDEVKEVFVEEVRRLISLLIATTSFYQIGGNTLEEARGRVHYLKDVIENKGGHRIFYVDGEPVLDEKAVHIMFRFCWVNTPSDVNREVDNGRGPSDFEVSRGRFDKSLIEFKLARNSKLRDNLQKQVEIYQKASDAQAGLKVIVFFTKEERARVIALLRELKMDGDNKIILIDARADNKPSASKVKGDKRRARVKKRR